MRIIREKLSWQKGSVPFYQNQWLANDEAINFADIVAQWTMLTKLTTMSSISLDNRGLKMMKKPMFLTLVACMFLGKCMALDSCAQMDGDGVSFYSEMIAAENALALTNALAKFRMLQVEQQEKVLELCLNHIRDNESIPFDEGSLPLKHDLGTVNGRCVWFSSEVLNVSLPVVNAHSQERDIADARRMIVDAVQEWRHNLELSNKEILQMPLFRRIDLSSSGAAAPNELAVLAGDSSAEIRLAVARNSRTPISSLARLASTDASQAVREAAINNLKVARTLKPNGKHDFFNVDLCGIVTKTNFVEYMKYLDSIGFSAIQDKLNPDGNPEKQGGLRDAAWLMWEKDIVFPANDENRADWSPPTNVVVDSLFLEVRASGVLRFDLLKNGNVVANGEVGVFKSCGEPMVAFMHQQAERFATTTMLIKFQIAKRLDVSYLGAETNMLYITERGSLEDSVTYKNITLKIRYKDDSLSKHRKAIAEALMTAGAVTKPKASKVSVTIKRDENN